jgi:hypothetical protein
MKPVLKFILLPILFVSVCCSTPLITSAATKPLTNSDVVAMIKAGLPENTIILSIQQTASKFDTAPQSLILLKKQGVSTKLLDAMLNKQIGKTTLSQSIPGKSIEIATSNVEFKGIRTLVEGKFIPMKRSKALSRSSGGFLGLGAFKGRAVFEGTRARLRLSNKPPAFEVALPPDINASEYITLVLLAVKADRRQIETSRASQSLLEGLVVKDGFPKDRIVATKLEDTGVRTPSGQIIYRIKVADSLPPGEYAVVRASTDSAEDEGLSDRKTPAANYYDFGIDIGS